MAPDKELIRKRFEANFSRYHRLALVQRDICAGLGCMAGELCRSENISRALEIGVGTGFLTAHLTELFPHAEWYLNDISHAAGTFVEGYGSGRTTFVCGDAENMEFPQGLDMIASASTVQWFDDLPVFAGRAAEATDSGGWLVLSTFGPDNFKEIRETTGEGLDYYPLDELCGIFESAGYRIVSRSEYSRSLNFGTPLDVLHHIKATGVNSVSNKRWNRAQLADFDARYRKLFPGSEEVALTYHPQLIIARKL